MIEPIQITPKQRRMLHRLLHDPNFPQHFHYRVAIILDSAQSIPLTKLGAKLGINRKTVGQWVRHWRHHMEGLQTLEAQGKDDQLLYQRIQEILQRMDTRRRPVELTDEQVARIRRLVLEDATVYGHRRWTMKTLAEVAMEEGIVEYIAPVKVSYLLRDISVGEAVH